MIEFLSIHIYAVIGSILLACFVGYINWRNNFKVRQANAALAFVEIIASEIAALSNSPNSVDAYFVLKSRFAIHHQGYITLCAASGWFVRLRLQKAWREYYGEEGEQEWWLPNEYSALLTNQLKNTFANTKQLAVHRLQYLIKICS